MIMRSQATSEKEPVMIVRIIKTPLKAMSKALDLYVKSVNNFAITNNRPLMIMDASSPTSENNALHVPRTFSILCESDLLPGALIRSISTTSTATTRSATHVLWNSPVVRTTKKRLASRKGGAGMRTIYEDRISSFKDDGIVRRKKLGKKRCLKVNCIDREVCMMVPF